MLKTRFIKLFLLKLENERYLLAVQDQRRRFLPVSEWKEIVFSRHEESFFGTLLEEETVGGVEGVVISGWGLVSLFGKEAFNRFVDWDWSEAAEICLAASGALYDGIVEKDWHPDFSAWEDGAFRWRLPERIMDEFDPSFWEQHVGGDGLMWPGGVGIAEPGAADDRGLGAEAEDGRGEDIGPGAGTVGIEARAASGTGDRVSAAGKRSGQGDNVRTFISGLYNDALDTYLVRNPAMKELFGPKLDLLKKQNISGRDLARYFDEERWLEWVGIKENDAPFTIGLRLDEPLDGEGPWKLDIFLRDKKKIDNLYDVSTAPKRWQPFLDLVRREEERWVKLIPWLGAEGSVRGDADADRAGIGGDAAAAGDVVGIDAGAAGNRAVAELDFAGEPAPPPLKTELTEEEAWEFLTEASETLIALNVEILLPSWWQAMKNANLKMKASLRGTSSHRPSFVGLQAMLDFNWRFSMNGVDLSEDEFNRLVEDKRRLVYIRGRWVKLDPQFIKQIQDLMKRAEKEGLHVRDLLEQELVQDEVPEEELENPKAFAKIQIELNRSWKQMIKQLSEIKEIPQQPVPAGLNGELRPYQQLGMSWLWFLRQYGFGACLADDMGLGKTVQLISYLLMVKEREKTKTAAIASAASGAGRKTLEAGAAPGTVPTAVAADAGRSDEDSTGVGVDSSALAADSTSSDVDSTAKENAASHGAEAKTTNRRRLGENAAAEKEPTKAALIICPTSVLGNWQKELERFAPEMDVYLHYGPNRLKGAAFSARVKKANVVLTSYGLSHLDQEEFERMLWSTIAIDEAQNIKNANTKQSRAVRRLRGLHHIALTGTPMENRLTELWSIFDFTNHGYLGSLGQFQKKFVIPIEKDESKDKVHSLQALIRPFLLRRTKKDDEVALNLPDKQEQKEYCPLTAEQASLYEQLVKDTFAEIEKLTGFERKGLILQMLSRLKQLCNHPALYLKEKAMTHLLDRSNKMEKLVELIDAVLEQEESCLIFTQYIEMGEMIRTLLKRKFSIEVPFLNGSVPKAQRDTMIERFQNREFPVFLLSLKAGGTGLNLTAANHVIHYDRWWNPAVENQATDRAYRIGQQRFVHVHKLICTGTLEEKIDAMLEKKQFLNDQIIQSENWITELSTDELRDLVFLG